MHCNHAGGSSPYLTPRPRTERRTRRPSPSCYLTAKSTQGHFDVLVGQHWQVDVHAGQVHVLVLANALVIQGNLPQQQTATAAAAAAKVFRAHRRARQPPAAACRMNADTACSQRTRNALAFWVSASHSCRRRLLLSPWQHSVQLVSCKLPCLQDHHPAPSTLCKQHLLNSCADGQGAALANVKTTLTFPFT